MRLSTRTLRIATAVAAAAAVAAVVTVPEAGARTAYGGNPCTLLTAKQVAGLHIGTACTHTAGLANPYYSGVSASWGKLGGTKGSIILAVNKVKQAAYIKILESQTKTGTSFGVGSWSRGSCAATGRYCIVNFVVGLYVAELQVAPPASHPLPSSKPVIAIAKSAAAALK